VLEFTEYLYPQSRYGSVAPLPRGQEIATRSVAIGAASAASAPFDARTQLIVISAVSADCRIAIGAPGTEALNGFASTRQLNAGLEYAFDVAGGQVLAAIALADSVTPTIDAEAAGSVEEGVALAHPLAADEAVDFTISGGADGALFEISQPDAPSPEAVLRFLADGVQDFSAPADADTDNDYEVEITATDANGNDDALAIVISVTEA